MKKRGNIGRNWDCRNMCLNLKLNKPLVTLDLVAHVYTVNGKDPHFAWWASCVHLLYWRALQQTTDAEPFHNLSLTRSNVPWEIRSEFQHDMLFVNWYTNVWFMFSCQHSATFTEKQMKCLMDRGLQPNKALILPSSHPNDGIYQCYPACRRWQNLRHIR